MCRTSESEKFQLTKKRINQKRKSMQLCIGCVWTQDLWRHIQFELKLHILMPFSPILFESYEFFHRDCKIKKNVKKKIPNWMKIIWNTRKAITHTRSRACNEVMNRSERETCEHFRTAVCSRSLAISHTNIPTLNAGINQFTHIIWIIILINVYKWELRVLSRSY